MKINVHIVAPYESMVPVIKECIPQFPTFEITYSIGDLAEGVKLAIQAEKNGAEIIISRGGTAQLIKKAVRIPVIDMHLSGYDMIRSLLLATNLGNKTAIVGFANITSGAQSIIDLLDFPLKVFTVSDSDEVASLILKLKNSGYQQIVGDVITVKTSNTYGLKGFLIQSGKESIIKSLEDAKLLYSYLNENKYLTRVFEQFILKDIQNFMIVNDKNQIIYEHWTDFSSNPLTENQLQLLNTDLEMNKKEISGNFVIDENVVNFTGCHIQIHQQSFNAIAVEKNGIPILEQKGLTIHTHLTVEPIAATSNSIKTILNHLELLYKNNEITLIQGRKGTGKNFIAQYIHNKLSEQGIFLTINFEEFDSACLETLPIRNISTVKLIHTEYIEDGQKLSRFLKECQKSHVRVVILTENMLNPIFNQEVRINKIILPDLSERKEDIGTLAQYFIAYYHQKYGTPAVKITSDALQFLEEYTYPNNIDDLKSLIKQITLNAKDYVIQKETVESAISTNNLPVDAIFQKGTLKEIEKEIIKWALKAENNNQTKAAERLGINRATLWRKLKE